MAEVTTYLEDTYKILRNILGSKLGLLGQYEYLVKGAPIAPPVRDYAISILQILPDPRAEYKLVSQSGLEVIIEGESNLKTTFLNNDRTIARECYKVTILQHKDGDYQALHTAIKAIYSIPSIKPLDTPAYRPRMQIDNGLKGKDASFAPSMAVLKLRRNY